MSWARAAGLCTPEFTLRHVSDFDQIPEEMPTGDGKVFVIERFDRTHTGRVHIEDFGQILDRPPGHSQYFGISTGRSNSHGSLNHKTLIVFSIALIHV